MITGRGSISCVPHVLRLMNSPNSKLIQQQMQNAGSPIQPFHAQQSQQQANSEPFWRIW